MSKEALIKQGEAYLEGFPTRTFGSVEDELAQIRAAAAAVLSDIAKVEAGEMEYDLKKGKAETLMVMRKAHAEILRSAAILNLRHAALVAKLSYAKKGGATKKRVRAA